MKFVLLLFAFFANAGWALECEPPTVSKQVAGQEQTLMSWCETAAGVKDGAFEQFSVKHGLEVQAHYSNGKLDGSFKRLFPNGKVDTEGSFQDGRMTGVWTRYWDNGRIHDQGTWRDDHPVGEWKAYDTRGRIVRQTRFDESGKRLSSREYSLRTSERWRFRFGVTHAETGDHQKSADGPSIGVDFHLFELGRWLRSEISTRVLPEYNQEKDASTYSGQLTLAFEPIPYWLDPFAVTFRIGPNWTGFDKTRLSFNLGLRYEWQDPQPDFQIYGAYLEFGGADGGHSHGCQSPGCHGDGGSNFFSGGVIFSL